MKKGLKFNLQFFADEETTQEENNLENEDTKESTPDGSTTEDVDTKEEKEELEKAFLKVQYNHEAIDLDEEKARVLAQKGLAYDDLKSKYDDHKGLKFLENYAKKLNMSVDELVDQMEKQEAEAEVKKFQQTNGIEDEELAHKFYEDTQLAKKFREQEAQKQKELEEKQRQEKEYDDLCEFSENFLGKKFEVKDLPEEVVNLAKSKNCSLADAWAKHILMSQKKEKDIENLNSKNSGTSLGSVKNTNAPDETELTEADLERMTPIEISKNLSKVLKLLKK